MILGIESLETDKQIMERGVTAYFIPNYCSIVSHPDEDTRRKGKLKPKDSPPDEVAVTLLPEPGLKRRKNEPRGTFKLLQDRGMKISNYQEKNWRKDKKE